MQPKFSIGQEVTINCLWFEFGVGVIVQILPEDEDLHQFQYVVSWPARDRRSFSEWLFNKPIPRVEATEWESELEPYVPRRNR